MSASPRVLIADDQRDVREALRLLLKGEGFETVDEWREAHELFFGRPIRPETQIVAVRFCVVEQL